MRLYRFLTLLMPIALLILSSCTNSAEPSGASTTSKPTVLATFSILADLAQAVAGDDLNVITLVGPGSDAHTFEPTPNDSKLLSNAQMCIRDRPDRHKL